MMSTTNKEIYESKGIALHLGCKDKDDFQGKITQLIPDEHNSLVGVTWNIGGKFEWVSLDESGFTIIQNTG